MPVSEFQSNGPVMGTRDEFITNSLRPNPDYLIHKPRQRLRVTDAFARPPDNADSVRGN